MNPRYLWIAEGVELLAFLVVLPAVAIVIAYKAWREDTRGLQSYGMQCVISGGAGLLLFALAKWIDADVRTPQYFLQLGCMLLSLVSLGVSMGSAFPMFIGIWRWQKRTRLKS